MRPPPLVALAFFAAVPAFIGWGALDRRHTPTEYAAADAGEAFWRSLTTATPAAIDYTPTFRPLAPDLMRSQTATSAPQIVYDPEAPYSGLPESDGVNLVAGICSGCHTLEIVMQQRQTRLQWGDTLTWMIERQGMPRLPNEDMATIKSYLARHFGQKNG